MKYIKNVQKTNKIHHCHVRAANMIDIQETHSWAKIYQRYEQLLQNILEFTDEVYTKCYQKKSWSHIT